MAQKNQNTISSGDRLALYSAWSEDRNSSAPTPLKTWIARHPELANEIVRWATDAPILAYADSLLSDEATEARAQSLGKLALAEVRARYETGRVSAPASLIDTAKQKGWTVQSLTERLNIGRTTLAKLEQRLFRAATVPAQLVEALADALQVNPAQVKNYLNQSPTLAAGASYKSDGVPAVSEQEEFARAVRDCRDMTAEQKAYWLKIAQDR